MVRLGPSLAAALLDRLFEQPAGVFFCGATHVGIEVQGLKFRKPRPSAFGLRTLASRVLTQPAFGFGRRWGSERIVGPGVFGIAATEFFFYFKIGRLPEAGEILRDLDRPACWR